MILVVDDDAASCEVMSAALDLDGNTVFCTQKGEEALWVLETQRPHLELVLLDWFMPGLDGAQMLRILEKHYPEVPVAIITASPQCVRWPGVPVLAKPFELRDLYALVAAKKTRAPDWQRVGVSQN